MNDSHQLGFVLFVMIVGLVTVAIVKLNNKKSKPQNSKAKESISFQPRYGVPYDPGTVIRTGVQVLESAHLIGTSKAIDTIQGRYDFLSKIIITLKSAQNNARYSTDIQKSIDRYKAIYYNTIINNDEAAIILNPNQFDLVDFYSISLGKAFGRYYEDYLEQVKTLKRDDAKLRRRVKAFETLTSAKKELKDKCSTTKCFIEVLHQLNEFERQLDIEGNLISVKAPEKAAGQDSAAISEFVINPGDPFELTLLNATPEIVSQVRGILTDEKIYDNKKEVKIAALFATNNIQIKEVEEFRRKYSVTYNNKIEDLKNASKEWKQAFEKDKEDLLIGFRELASKEIYEQPNCDLFILFEKAPNDYTLDDKLIEEYGFENIRTYVKFFDHLEKVRVIPNDTYNRSKFESLVDANLAIRGNTIPKEEILNILSLKDLNEIASNHEVEYKRKNQAIDYIIGLPDVDAKLGAKVSLRELFKLKPLPPEYSSLNFAQLIAGWEYIETTASLFVNTYRFSQYTARSLSEKKYVKGYKIDCGGNENLCPCAKDMMNKTYTRTKPPQLPYHIGCSCMVQVEYEFSN